MASVKKCIICAWREDCKKKFSISKSGASNCPDFSHDVKIPVPEELKEDAGPEKT